MPFDSFSDSFLHFIYDYFFSYPLFLLGKYFLFVVNKTYFSMTAKHFSINGNLDVKRTGATTLDVLEI